MSKPVVAALAAGTAIVAGIVSQAPEIQRYLKMKAM
jgi:hypothetical protein